MKRHPIWNLSIFGLILVIISICLVSPLPFIVCGLILIIIFLFLLYNKHKQKRQDNEKNTTVTLNTVSTKKPVINTQNNKVAEANKKTAYSAKNALSTNDASTEKMEANQEINKRDSIFPIIKNCKNVKKVFYKKDDPHLVYLFTYEDWVDDNYMNHEYRIYFNNLTKKFVYRNYISTIPGYHTGQGWGFEEQYEICFDLVQEIINIQYETIYNRLSDNDMHDMCHKIVKRKEALINKIQALINDYK